MSLELLHGKLGLSLSQNLLSQSPHSSCIKCRIKVLESRLKEYFIGGTHIWTHRKGFIVIRAYKSSIEIL